VNLTRIKNPVARRLLLIAIYLPFASVFYIPLAVYYGCKELGWPWAGFWEAWNGRG
jgi:hypothetical protein